MKNFDYIDRKHGFCWKHKTKPCWIVFYDITHAAPFYEAYRVKSYVKQKAYQQPWACDNERISNGDGFKTLEEAMKAVELA